MIVFLMSILTTGATAYEWIGWLAKGDTKSVDVEEISKIKLIDVYEDECIIEFENCADGCSWHHGEVSEDKYVDLWRKRIGMTDSLEAPWDKTDVDQCRLFVELTCDDECTINEEECVGDDVYTCKSDSDGCRYLEFQEACDDRCEDGECKSSQFVAGCHDGDAYWYDNDGNRMDVKDRCDEDERCNGGECVDKCEKTDPKCVNETLVLVAHYDYSCYPPAECPERLNEEHICSVVGCDDGEICMNSQCVETECKYNQVVVLDREGDISKVIEECGDDEECTDGECTTLEYSEKTCFRNRIYSQTKNGNIGEMIEECKENEVCIDAICTTCGNGICDEDEDCGCLDCDCSTVQPEQQDDLPPKKNESVNKSTFNESINHTAEPVEERSVITIIKNIWNWFFR